MAISRKKKEQLVAKYKEQIENASAIVFTDYKGTTVPQIQSLRTKLQETGTTYTVVKNNLLGIALNEISDVQPEELLKGPNGIVFLGEDIGRGVKALKDWIKSEPSVEIKGAIIDGAILDADRADALSDLPTREETLALLLSAINAPANTLVRMLNAPPASLVRVINAHVEAEHEVAE